MAKIDNYRYPADLDPEEAEEFVSVLVNDFGGTAENREAFAQAAGHKTKDSGAFTRKVADARKYGLMTPRGDYEATEIGFRLANPRDETDRRKALFEMLENIELLSEIYDDLNGNEPPNQFWRVLSEITDTNPKEARDASNRVEDLYREMLRVEVNDTSEENTQLADGDGEDSAESTKENSQPNQKKQQEDALYLRVGDDELRFSELTDINIELAQRFLESKKGREESKEDGVQMRLG